VSDCCLTPNDQYEEIDISKNSGKPYKILILIANPIDWLYAAPFHKLYKVSHFAPKLNFELISVPFS
jgi:hypothetical protein